MARLAGSDESIETLRFWGKLQGRNKDYYVVEGKGGHDLLEGEGEDVEAEANKHSYWICSHIGGPWFRLPPVKPAAVLCAQKIRRFLSGDLSAPVSGYPPFPGAESDYVRATIALINADCQIAPKGYFLAEGDAVTLNEEYAGGSDLSSYDAWETHGLKFNSLGRVTTVERQDAEGNPVMEPEGWTTEWLSACSEEDWQIRKSPSVLENSKSQRIVLRSKRWPGAFAIGNSTTGSWSNIYVGFGTQASDTAYTPPMPPALQTETHANELKEQEDIREDPTSPEEDATEE